MRTRTRKGLALILVLAMVALCIPAGVYAADNENIITSVTLSRPDAAETNVDGKNIRITVPYSYPGDTLDMANNLTPVYDPAAYTGVIFEYLGESAAMIDDTGVQLKASYYNVTTSTEPAISCSSTYDISVVRKAPVKPTFSGPIEINTTVTAGYTFKAADFTGPYTQNDGGVLDKIKLTGDNLGVVGLKLDGTSINSGQEISISDVGKLTVSATAAGRASYRVTAYQAGNADPVGEATLTVSVLASTTLADVTASVSQLSTLPLTIPAADISSAFNTLTGGGTLDKVQFTLPADSNGKLYTGYTSAASPGTAVSAGTKYTASQLSGITFVPSRTYSGVVNIAYTAFDAGNNSYTGTLKITVNAASFAIANLTASTRQNAALLLKNVAFLSNFKSAASNKDLANIKFLLPEAAAGTLYYNYSSASSPGTALADNTYYTAAQLATMAFVPKSNYTGTVTLYYTAKNSDGTAEHNGKFVVTVTASGVADIAYSVAQDEVLHFSASDFNGKFKTATGKDLNYVKFSLPSSSNGTLYYNYKSASSVGTAVKAADKYYRTGSGALLANVTLAPKTSYTGSFTISYTAYDVSEVSYPGTVTVTVTKSSSDISTLSYSVDQGDTLTFSASDFNSKFKDATGGNLNYVKFSLPSSSYGVLYFDYTSAKNFDYKVSASDKFYRSDSPELSKVTLVPKSSYSGTFIINYDGYDNKNKGYTGKIQINVKDGGAEIALLSYSIDEDETLTFSASDFNSKFKDVSDDENLSYVQFSLPSSSYGTLYYDYRSSSKPGTAVKASDKYYRSGSSNKLLSDVTFVPKSGYEGNVTISYTAYNSSGNAFTGKIKIAVGDVGDLANLTYSIANTETLRISDSDINGVFKKLADSNFVYLKFSLPPGGAGALHHDYKSASDPGTYVKASTKYYRSSSPYVEDVTFVPSANFSGTVQIEYTAYDSDDNEYDGVIKITVTKASGASAYFRDVTDSYSWAAAQIDYLYQKGVVKGLTTTEYGPAQNITRADFMLMLYRAFNLKATTSGNFSDVPVGSYYYDAIAVAKALNIAQGSGGKFNPNGKLTRQDAMVLVYRTMVVTGERLTAGTNSDLARFTDQGSIASYATTAVATLVRAGVIDGYNDRTFRPTGLMTRAEMAVVLYRVDQL